MPLVISHPQARQPTQDEIDAKKKEVQQADANKDWLLRSYEEQLRRRTSGQPGGDSDNLYYRIAADKSLSKLAGVGSLSPSPDEASGAQRTGANFSGGSTFGLRPDLSRASGINPSSFSIPLFKPLITPLGAADAAGLHNFYGTQNEPAPPAPAPKSTDTTRISPDLDMPGQVGAGNNPLSKDSLTFDTLPDDVQPDKASPRAHIAEDALPLTTNAEQIQKLNDTALNAPGTIKTVTPKNGTSLQLKYQEDPAPVKLPAPSPVRQPIPNPYDILDH